MSDTKKRGIEFGASGLAARVGALVGDLLYNPTLRQAVRYEARNLVIKATARRRRRKVCVHHEILVTIGRPNWKERKFIKGKKCLFPLFGHYLTPWKNGRKKA